EIAEAGAVGRGEATAIYYHGESAASVLADIKRVRPEIEAGLDRIALQAALPRGAARNALDCALWDLDAKRSGRPVWQLAGLMEPRALVTAFTISVGDPDRMEADARASAGLPLLKL